jgi:hypothetical protein
MAHCSAPAAWPAKATVTDAQIAIEREFKNVFFNKTSDDRERIISVWMVRRQCTRYEAMRFAVDEWRSGQRTWR